MPCSTQRYPEALLHFNPQFFWLASHSIPLLDYFEIHLWDYILHSVGGSGPVLNEKSVGSGEEWAGPMPACLYDSELETAKSKKRTHFAVCSLCTDTAERHTTRCDSSLWCIAFFFSFFITPWLHFESFFHSLECLYPLPFFYTGQHQLQQTVNRWISM